MKNKILELEKMFMINYACAITADKTSPLFEVAFTSALKILSELHLMSIHSKVYALEKCEWRDQALEFYSTDPSNNYYSEYTKEDIYTIANVEMHDLLPNCKKHIWKMGEETFELVKDFPDITYKDEVYLCVSPVEDINDNVCFIYTIKESEKNRKITRIYKMFFDISENYNSLYHPVELKSNFATGCLSCIMVNPAYKEEVK